MNWRFQVRNLGRSAWLLAWIHSVFTFAAFAHPASGIVADSQRHVYFTYSAHGVMRIETSGEPNNIHRDGGGHWLALDSSGSFSRVTPKLFERITPDGSVLSLIFASGGAPLVVGQDRDLYYGTNGSQEDSFAPELAQLRGCRLQASRNLSLHSCSPNSPSWKTESQSLLRALAVRSTLRQGGVS
jgi:hypothetical protein